MTTLECRACVNGWLAEAAPGAGLTLDDRGICYVADNDGGECTLEVPEPDAALHFYAVVANVPHENAEPLLRRALQLNLFQAATGGAAVAWDPAANVLLLCYSQTAEDLTATTFKNVLDNFLQRSRIIGEQIGADLGDVGGMEIPRGAAEIAMMRV